MTAARRTRRPSMQRSTPSTSPTALRAPSTSTPRATGPLRNSWPCTRPGTPRRSLPSRSARTAPGCRRPRRDQKATWMRGASSAPHCFGGSSGGADRLESAEVCLLYPLVLGQSCRFTLEHDAPDLDDVGAVRDGQGLARVLLYQQDRGASVGDLTHRLQHASSQDRREPKGWLIEHQHLGP